MKVIFFDGVCHFCNGWVQWLLKKDRRAIFHFASLQSEAGIFARQQMGLLVKDAPESVIYYRKGKWYAESDAVFMIMYDLGGMYRVLSIFRYTPKAVRNFFYRWVARNRYRWFGKRDQCMIPDPVWKDRFIDFWPQEVLK